MAEVAPPPSVDRYHTIIGQGGIQTDLDLNTIGDAEVADVIPDLLADYSAECKDWTTLAGEHWRQKRFDRAAELIQKGIQFFAGGPGRHPDHQALVNLHSMLAHLHLALARTAPKVSLPHAKYDKIAAGTKTKENHYTEAAANLNRADSALEGMGTSQDEAPTSLALGKIILSLARGQPAVAQPMVERLLQRQPNNIVALTAQARLQFARRAHDGAFQTYQKLLALDPEMSPDPRIGLGLCAWLLGDKEKARLAWERSLERDPSSWTSLLLLGLAALNTAREPSVPREERLRLEAEGVALVQKAFKLNNKSSAAALALASISGQGGQLPVASKLAERAIQYADNRRHAALANAERGRLGFAAGDVVDAGRFIAAAKQEEGSGVNIMAELTLGQIAIKNGNLREALNFIEQTAKRLNGKGPLEYSVLHACLLAYPHPGMKDDEIAKNRVTARQMLSELHQLVVSASTDEDWAKLRGIAGDPDIFVELAKLWQDDNLEKTIGSYQTAVSIISDESESQLDTRAVKMSSNLGALYQLQGSVDTAEGLYQEALSKVAQEEGKDAEVLKTVLAYNLARAYEEGGDVVKASQWYRDVLRQHPEHMESKVRLALIAASAGRNYDAHTLLKECLKSDETNVTLRTIYSNFLISLGSLKEALQFTSQTLKYDRSDSATFCALGSLHFSLGREAKQPSEIANRSKEYLRSAEAYQRALDLDPTCAVAAQGLAIALAEDTLALKTGAAANVGGTDDVKNRMKLAGQALSVFSRISDSLPVGAVNVNMGHCYFARGEEDKAIQAYEAASNTFKGRNVSVLLYLARAWYAYANSQSNFSAMSKALGYCQKAMHVQPSDRAILYNIAMILQKGAELLQTLDPSTRTSEELAIAVRHAQQAVSIFRTLADDESKPLPYDVDLADQRARYGDTILRRLPVEMEKQQAYESEAQARVEQARQIRAAEQAKIREQELAHLAELERKAAEIAEKRREDTERAQAWQRELAERQIQEAEKKASLVEKRRKRKEEGEIESADDGEGGEKKPKKRKAGGKKSRKVRSKSEVSSESDDDEGEARATPPAEEEEAVDPAELQARKARLALEKLRGRSKKKAKKEAKVDPDGDEDMGTTSKKGKQYKSKAFIEDSDEEAEADEPAEDAKQEGSEEPSGAATPADPQTNGHSPDGETMEVAKQDEEDVTPTKQNDDRDDDDE